MDKRHIIGKTSQSMNYQGIHQQCLHSKIEKLIMLLYLKQDSLVHKMWRITKDLRESMFNISYMSQHDFRKIHAKPKSRDQYHMIENS